MNEPHVEHLVGLVEDEDLDVVEPHGALVEVVDQPAGGGDEHVDAAHQPVDLRTDGDATEDGGDRQAEVLAVNAEALRDLAGELACRREDKRAACVLFRPDAIGSQTMKDRQGEGGRLAGPRLGDAEQILAGKDMGDGLRLDRRRRDVVLALQRLEKGGGESEVAELSQERLSSMRERVEALVAWDMGDAVRDRLRSVGRRVAVRASAEASDDHAAICRRRGRDFCHLGAFARNVKLGVAAHTRGQIERDGFTQVTDAIGLIHSGYRQLNERR